MTRWQRAGHGLPVSAAFGVRAGWARGLQRRPAMQRRPRGFTRVEGLLAIGIATVVASAAVWMTDGGGAEHEDQAQVTARRIVEAASDWHREHQVGCPTLTQLIVDRRWELDARADDPWGGRYRIHCSEGEVNVRSAGRDGRFQTRDDVSVSAPWTS